MSNLWCFGFQIGSARKNKSPKNPKEELVHFGDLCCCKGTFKGISDYHLPNKLEMLHTSNKKINRLFRKDARTYNNAMAMCSIAAQHGRRNRAHKNKSGVTTSQESWAADNRRWQATKVCPDLLFTGETKQQNSGCWIQGKLLQIANEQITRWYFQSYIQLWWKQIKMHQVFSRSKKICRKTS